MPLSLNIVSAILCKKWENTRIYLDLFLQHKNIIAALHAPANTVYAFLYSLCFLYPYLYTISDLCTLFWKPDFSHSSTHPFLSHLSYPTCFVRDMILIYFLFTKWTSMNPCLDKQSTSVTDWNGVVTNFVSPRKVFPLALIQTQPLI